MRDFSPSSDVHPSGKHRVSPWPTGSLVVDMNTPRTNTGDALDLVQDAEWSLLTTNLATEGEYLTYVFLNLFYLFICRDLNYIPYSVYGRYALTGLRSL